MTAGSIRSGAVPEARQPTPRQLEVLRLLAQGLTDDEAARALGLSRQSVKNHKTELFRRMKVHSKVEAFIVMGWLRLP